MKLGYFTMLGLIFFCGRSVLAQLGPTEPVCDVRKYGAQGDGMTADTVAIQAAVDACAGSGGTVLLDSGTFLTGTIKLKSGIHLKIEASATLKGTQNDEDYPDLTPPTANTQLGNCRKALIYGESVQNVVIEGSGTIDGNGNTPKWLGPAKVHPERTRPMAVFFALSDHVTIQEVHVREAAMWAVVALETDHLWIHDVAVHTDLSGTRDGIDVVDGHHVVIENSNVFSEDDSICLKSGVARGVDDVMVRNCQILQSSVANGLKLGTASTGRFTNVTFQDITIDNVDKAAMAIESVDGAMIENIQFKRVQFRRAGSAIFVLLGKRGEIPAVGSISNILFEDIRGTQMKHSWGSALSGTEQGGRIYAPSGIVFRNVQIESEGGLTMKPPAPPEYAGQYPDPNLWGNLPAANFYLRHLRNVQFFQSKFWVGAPDARPSFVTQDVSN